MVTTTATTLISNSNGTKHTTELYQKINRITTYQRPYIRTILNKSGENSQDNTNLICDYIINEQNTFNIKESTKEGKIKVLVWLSNHFQDEKKFIDMTKHDIVSYLHKLRKPISEDPKQIWIGSYNIRQLIIVSFFKWLFDPGESDYRARKIPECVNGIKKLPTREKSKYTSSDIWSEKEIGLFLKYCPNKRDRCYLAMAFDMSARPSEILNLKLKDIIFKKSDQQIQYAEVEIKGGKTGTRIVPLIDSIPYVKDWIENGHPNGNNPDSWLFVSLAKTNFGSRLTYDGLLKHFKDFYKNKYFPQLVSDSSIPQADRSFLKNILTKPFSMYIFRHSALTKKSIILKEHMLRSHAGWSINSKMPQVYLHYFGNESSKSLLEVKGVIKEKELDSNNVLRPQQCSNCNEPNKPDSKWCSSCKMVLSYDSYNETVGNENEMKDALAQLSDQILILNERIQKLEKNK